MTAKRNTVSPKKSTSTEPERRMPNICVTMSEITADCASPTIKPGTALPITISNGCSGDTSNCSKVPSSRSRATDMPTIMSTIVIGNVAMRIGTIAAR